MSLALLAGRPGGSHGMQSANAIALKEWAAVCAALESGRQTILLRKGGIDEGPRGFRIEYPEFWLYPTQFHQDASQLSDEGRSFLAAAQKNVPAPGRIAVSLYYYSSTSL